MYFKEENSPENELDELDNYSLYKLERILNHKHATLVPPAQYKQTPFQNRLSEDDGEIAQNCNIHALLRGAPGSIPCIAK